MNAKASTHSRTFDASRESQDEYCNGCANLVACNVMLKDGEECGDRYAPPDQDRDFDEPIFCRILRDALDFMPTAAVCLLGGPVSALIWLRSIRSQYHFYKTV